MKTLGLIGGMSWESSKVYYELINKKANKFAGGFNSCKSILYSVDFAKIEHYQTQNNFKKLNEIMIDAAVKLEKSGADLLILCTNTMHLCFDAISKNISVPFLHIADATGEAITQQNIKNIGLSGTNFTMEEDFYKTVIKNNYHINTIIPEKNDCYIIHDTIYNELVHGKIKEQSKENFKHIIKKLAMKGAEGIILGCTEIPLLISSDDSEIPIFETTKIQAEKVAELILE
ncbi:MAG: aspartate racemase [Bacteroidetes bacterium]|nr:MAG: aspartate racemase [Bacteroidota bacterium]